MNQRPVSVTIIGCLFVVAGALDIASHFPGFKALHPFPLDFLWPALLGLIAIACGAYLLRGHNWARWLALAWMAFHVVLSAFHTRSELAIHSLFFAILAYLLFRRPSTRYFRPAA